MTAVRTSSRTQRIGFRGIKTTTDESVLDWDYTPEMFNYRIENGTLTGGLGFSDAQGFAANGSGARHDYPALPSGVFVEDIFHYRRRASGAYDDRIVIRSSSGALYYTSVFRRTPGTPWKAIRCPPALRRSATTTAARTCCLCARLTAPSRCWTTAP